MASRTVDEVGPFTSAMRFIFKNILMHLCITLGVLGNILTLIVLLKRKMRRSSTAQYLAALTLFDLIYIICVFINSLEIIYPNTKHDLINPFLNLIFYPLGDFASNTSVYLILMYSIERYIAVAYPLTSLYWCRPSRARKIIGLTILFTFSFTFPTFLENKIVFVYDQSINSTRAELKQTNLYPNFGLYKIIYYWLIAVIVQFIPLTLLIIFNGILIKYIHRTMKNKKNNQNNYYYVSNNDNYNNCNLLNANGNHNNKNGMSRNSSNLLLNKKYNCLNLKSNKKKTKQKNLLDYNNNNNNNQGNNKNLYNFTDIETYKPNSRPASPTRNIHSNPVSNDFDDDFVKPKPPNKINSAFSLNSKRSSQTAIEMRIHVRNKKSSSSSSQSEQTKASLLLVATVLVFLICQLPNALLLIYDAIFPLEKETSKYREDIIYGLNNIANGLTAINASVNFILYSCFSDRFRQTFQSLFFKKF